MTFDDILTHLKSRLHLVRTFRQKIAWVPGGIDHPYWVEDENFDLEFHVRHTALPKPGNWQQLRTQVARLQAQPLTLSRPLWELHFVENLDDIEGMPPGSFALVLKVHHAAVDGQSGVEMISAIHTQRADEADPPGPDVPWQAEHAPSPWELWARAGANAFTLPARGARLARKTASALHDGLPGLWRKPETARPTLAPMTRFNRPLGAHRVVGVRFYDLSSVKKLRAIVPGSTVNDVALCVLGGAIRQYLLDLDELPQTPLRAMAPVSVRTETEHADMGNHVTAMVVSLATDVADPVERLAAVHESTSASKEWTSAIGARNLSEISQFASGALIGLGTRLAGETARQGVAGAYNTVVTNVPGPRQPLYFAGAKRVHDFMGGPLSDGVGLFNVVSSYVDEFVLSFAADRKAMPDPEHYADCIDGSMTELAKSG